MKPKHCIGFDFHNERALGKLSGVPVLDRQWRINRRCSTGKAESLPRARAWRVATLLSLLSIANPTFAADGADNRLTDDERRAGWVLLFDGRSLDGWTTSSEKPSQRPVEDGCINPHRCGGYMLIHEKPWENFQISLDFKLSPGCNSGVFLRTWPLTPRPGKDVGFNGIEVALDDTRGAGFHDTGALYDLVEPAKNAMKPAGEWNRMVITCDRNRIEVELNGEHITQMDLDEWPEPNRRPDGTMHKFDTAFKDHPRRGYLGLQDHGQDCWFKNIKLREVSE